MSCFRPRRRLPVFRAITPKSPERDQAPQEAESAEYSSGRSRTAWSRNILALKIDSRTHERKGKTITNFPATLPPVESDMAGQVFKDPYLFDFLGTADPRREREVEQVLKVMPPCSF